MNFVKSSLKYPQVTLSVLFLVFVIGVNSLLNMPRREDPKITIRSGLVLAFYPGANSAQVEDQVTKKLEQYLFQFEEVRKEKTFSTTRDGAVIINVELEESVKNPDIFWSKLRHEMLLAKTLDLPQGVRGPIVNSDFGDTEALVIGIVSDKADYSQLKNYTQKLEDGIRTIKAVSKIKRIGEQKEQITVTSNSEKLVQYGVKLPQVVKVLQSQNAINATGDVKTNDSKVPLYTSGYYNTENQIASQIVGTSNTGAVIRLGDVATVSRIFQEPTSKTTVDGHKAMMLAVEMHEGNNIVQFGEQVGKKIEEVSKLLPSDVKLTTIINQPKIVDENISHFIHEFFLAIISVVIVVILLLPLRIAAVAAMAIPMTVAVTFALLHTFGIELHQVSLAALIVVLGMVVDDAIVIADNYVELLDEGVERWEAAWRSASDLVVPVLTATITIIAAFMPMVILTGSVGEFIFALPITVTIALAASFIVAMILTPLLCYTFIKKGLHDHSEKPSDKKERISMLDRMQNGYNRAIAWCMKHPKFTISGSILSIALSGVLFLFIKQKFFPAAERNQFVVEVWMPTGTKLDKTEKAILKVEDLVKNDKRVSTFATFTGTSAPRFYYNFSPEVPVSNYAQILVNTTDDKTAEELADELSKKVDRLIPDGNPQVKLMQQGSPTKAPVEVRIIGDDLSELKRIGLKVKEIIQKAKGSTMVRSDFKEDYYGIDIDLKDEANRLGFTTTSIAQTVYTGFSGAPVSTMYEGNNPVDIVLRLDEKSRQNSDDLQNMYLSSPATGASIPLRQIADLKPQWQTGRIMHRNGVRTLTIQSETKDGALPSEIIKQIQPEIATLQLPAGYRIEYGGELENKKETFSQMVIALAISLVLIFFILLFQFRNLKESALVMASIPLSLFGALLGLIITHNNFGFTAFVGLISLSGIVVRNAIILVDYTNELLRKGMDIPTAATEAGKRRLRPIFLTAMAAAIGVLPMILSGSPMWSPLASVIAVGVVFSMVMALLVVPVLYVAMIKPADKKDSMLTSNEAHHVH
ncbi:Multidrug efflux pump subunit AcrB [Pseudarcicella hirudinis]|uniref:Multidrug efflux pump subunit AcrB n=1 Tax=Pseudarcicella hirudinis TaxID=1079859 RepID=A0A1I5QGN8_9BACT|nr:efflux RND transporter permease subunit [Pseudarcicella hirudinis]SFP45425.1 Multidrug efflux pump subunit AcrB [Pseudarcicella hirudinis]